MSASTIRGTIAGLGSRANPAFAGGVVGVSVLALAYVSAYEVTGASVQAHTYIHVMAGLLWTGTDLFMGAVLGPVIGGLDEEESAAVFSRLTPKTAFFLPAMALVTIAGGITLAQRVGLFPNAGPWLALFTAVNVIPVLLLVGRRLNAFGDRRWQAAFAVGTVGSLAWVATTVGRLNPASPEPGLVILLALGIVTLLSVQGFGYLMPGEIRMYREMTSANPDSGVIARIGTQNAKLGGIQGLFQLVVIALMVSLRYGGF
ncbi:hypothetical protein [Halosegnis marinus]|uniref:Uncharacterized protein n=1 Tax=Halosegnis marinus TaxID=3034023 RepID=A0ABD5ZM40_9EURY|nr:hypothetical protein [Halosegnis sp. DT85]